MCSFKKLFFVGGLLFLTGCSSLLPKPVEFFQDKVKAVPSKTVEHKEVVKEVADFVARRSEEAHIQAIKENSSTNLTYLTYETSIAADSLSHSIGKPLTPWKYEAEALSLKLNKLEAKLDQKLDNYREKVQENVGAKIEGSGAFSVPYLVYIGIIGFLIVFIFFAANVALKVFATLNPPVALGISAAQLPIKMATKGFGQVIKGLESAKDEIKKLNISDKAKNEILKIIREKQMNSQDSDIQSVIRELTKK